MREINDSHLANIACILVNTNSKTKYKAEQFMILITEDDKKENLAKTLKAELQKAGRGKIKIIEKS